MSQTVAALVEEAKKLGGKYEAALLIGDLGDQNAIQRRDGFFDVIDKNKDLVQVVHESLPSGIQTRLLPV